MVKRFEGVINDQIKENISKFINISNEMQEIKENISSLKEEIECISKSMCFLEKSLHDQNNKEISLMNKNFEENSSYIRSQSKTLHNFYEKIEERLAGLAGLAEIEKSKNEANSKFKQVHERIESEVSQFFNMIHILNSECKNREEKNIYSIKDLRKIVDLSKEFIDEKIKLFLIEHESIKKENDLLKKRIFISEKKIENIYTLIERAKK